MKPKQAADINQRLAELGADVEDHAFMTGYLLTMVADQCNEIAGLRDVSLYRGPYLKFELIFNSRPETRQ